MGFRYNKKYKKGRDGKPLPNFKEKVGKYKESRQVVPEFYIPFDYQDCFNEYLPPQWDYIYCPNFGNCDILDVQCHRCHDLFFYQWAMCQDETWVNEIMHGGKTELTAKYGTNCSREEAQLHIMRYKKMLFEANFNKDDDAAFEDFNKNVDSSTLVDRLKKKQIKTPAEVAAEAALAKKQKEEKRHE